jgi:hypothetical protein
MDEEGKVAGDAAVGSLRAAATTEEGETIVDGIAVGAAAAAAEEEAIVGGSDTMLRFRVCRQFRVLGKFLLFLN